MSSSDATFAIDRCSTIPLFQQIYRRARAAIEDGRLRPGERLPSARSLAAQLGAARGTIETAYAMLAGEGWIVARGAAGTVVAPQLRQAGSTASTLTSSKHAGAPALPAQQAGLLPFRMGMPALDAFPRKLWSRLIAREAQALNIASLAHPDIAGERQLREAIAAYLAISRGVACHPEQVFVTAGYQGALTLITRAVLEPGAPAWFEDPGYYLARNALAAAGTPLVPVPVDDHGLIVERALAAAPDAKAAIVTPAHHSPLGVTLSLPRRLALLDWAKSRSAWIVEDDYDGEFHYQGRPLAALKSLDRDDVVIYAGSFSKVLFPGLRLGYLVAPERLVARFTAAALTISAGLGRLEQAVVARFIEEGHFARHLRRMRQLYAARRASLARALVDVFGDGLVLSLQGGGMHLLAWPDGGLADTELVRRAEAQGLAPSPLSMHAIAAACKPGLLLSFTNIPEDQAESAARRLLAALKQDAGADSSES
ncbi:MAG: PLP-dependent aminotransferase family protein [Alphaproteobacteria bacterium]|nr:PLP-dependent aminotransferase family protein [Alphaproteobacteria bacterium]